MNDIDQLTYQLIEMYQDQQNGAISFNTYIEKLHALITNSGGAA